MPDVKAEADVDLSWDDVLEAMEANLELEDVVVGATIETSDGAIGKVLELKPGLLKFTWEEPGWLQQSTVTIRLAAKKLTIQHVGLDAGAAAWYQEFWADELAILSGEAA